MVLSPSIWELESFYAPKDVIIAGAGFAGLWSAYYLKKNNPFLKILIIEKEVIPTGASSRNAGFACFGSVTELMDDAKISGKENMIELVAMRYGGLRKIQEVFTVTEIDYEQLGGYELITGDQYTSSKEIKADIDWLNDSLHEVIGQKNIFRLADKKIIPFNFQKTNHLIQTELEGQLHPGKMMQVLLQKVLAMGIIMKTGIELKSYEYNGPKIVVHTGGLVSITTSQLLICTNTSANELLPATPITPARGQILVTSPINDLSFKGTFHCDEGFYYFRNIGNRVLLGGARNKAFSQERTTDPGVSKTIQQELERFLKDVVLPGKTFTIEHRWSGTMGMGRTKFPSIIEIKPNCFCLVGLGGMGVALAPVAGEQVAKMMIGN
ncbi:MAG: FAD-dependent oxidoreductase [Chitinophagaceae bacterium]